MDKINWTQAQQLEGKSSGKFHVNPTREMAAGIPCLKIHTWKIKGVTKTFEVTYDRDYAIAWIREKLKFCRGLPSDKVNQLITEAVSGLSDLSTDTNNDR